jgi:hypothetical protein
MISILFHIFFGFWSLNEMQEQNDFRRVNRDNRIRKWLPYITLADIIIIIICLYKISQNV